MERTNSQQQLTPAEIFRPPAELNLSQDDMVELDQQDIQVIRRGQGPITQNFIGSTTTNPKLLSSQASQVRKSQSKRESVTKIQITQEDLDRLASFKSTLDRAKEFRERSKQLDFATPIAQQDLQSVVSPSQAKKGIFSSKKSATPLSPNTKKTEIEHFLEAINEIVHADQVNKHQTEVEQVDKITRVISSARQGENCRDVLRYISNLRQNFNQSVQALDGLTNQLSEKYSRWIDIQTQQQNALSAEIDKNRRIGEKLNNREKENTQLKQQLEQCLNLLSQKDTEDGVQQQIVVDITPDQEDGKRELDIISISSKIESELQSNKAHNLLERFRTQLDSFLSDNRKIKSTNKQLELQLEAQSRNLTYLEDKLAANLTDYEEKVVELKSQIILNKQKARTYKQKLNADLEELKKEVVQSEVDSCFKEKQQLEIQLSRVQSSLTQKEAELGDLKQQAIRHNQKLKQLEKDHNIAIEVKETKIQTLHEQIERLERESTTKLQIQMQRNQSERREITVLEQEQQLKDLRLEYLENNQKKIQQQKKFLEEQVSKDIKEMQQQMVKTSLEIKKNQLISSQSAMQQLEVMYLLMQNSLRHVTRVVSFMTFDEDSQRHDNISSVSEQEKERQLQDSPMAVKSETGISQLKNNLFNEPSTQDLSVDQILQKHPYELLEAIIGWVQSYFASSNGPPTDEIDYLLNLLRQKTSPPRVDDIQRHFLSANRLHYEQHIFRLNEKTNSLQSERDRLQIQLTEMHSEMQRVLEGLQQDSEDEQSNQQAKEFGQVEPIQYRKKKTAPTEEVLSERQTTSKAKQKQETQNAQTTLVKRVNQALSERVREIKLILNRRYFDLEDNMKLQKENYESQIQAIKVQFGKDLNLVHLDNKKALALQRRDMAEQHKNDVIHLKSQLGEQFKKLKSDFEDQMKKLNKEKIEERIKKENYYSELKKQKSESTGLYQGAFGTFSIAFENPLHTKLAKCQQQLVECQKEMEGIRASLSGAKSKVRNKAVQAQLEKEDHLQQQCSKLIKAMDEIEILPREKLDHFIQVGFQMSNRNFLPLVTYNEQAYESVAKKYVFEFQDQIEPNADDYDEERPMPADLGLLQLENKFRQQISDNTALFNEINPIYVSLNMGRPVSTSSDTSLPIEKFRLAERLSANIASQYLTVNFMKTDLPFQVLRLVAFNNQNCASYELDLTKEDLLVFLEGNARLLEEENSADLYQMILNALTLISRTTQTRAGPFTYQVLAVEHRCFFNELYRSHWDARNKLLKARHNKIKQGLVNEVSLMTNFDQSLVYEGFADVYKEEVCMEVDSDTADHFEITLQRGVHSGHLKLIAKLMYAKDVEQTLCLVRSELANQGKVQNISAVLLQKPEIGDATQALAYIISMEMVFGSGSEESIVIKLSSIQKKFADQMKSFKWQGEGSPNLASTRSVQKVIYLASKIGEPTKYCQVKDFEILNTEVRAQLFAHAFGYDQRIVDFGDLSTSSNESFEEKSVIMAQTERNRSQVESPISNSKRERTNQSSLKASKQTNLDTEINKLLYRKFTIIRVVTVDEQDGEDTISHYAQVAFFTNQRLLEQQLVEVFVQVPEIDVRIQSEITPLSLLSEIDFQNFSQCKQTEQHGNALIDQLALVLKKDKSKIMLDTKLEPFSSLLAQLQQQQFDDNFANIGQVQFQLEISDSKSLQLTKSELLNSPKTQKVTVIGKRPFKVTCYFIFQLKEKKVKQHNLFDFDCMVIQAQNSTLDRTFEIVLTEHDIGTLVEMIQEATQHKTAAEYQIDYRKIFNSSLTHQQLFDFALDALQFNPEALSIYVSFEQLLNRLVERRKLENLFLTSGGTFVTDQQLLALNTNTQLRRKLVVMLDKDVSNSKINIKVYRCELASLPGQVKLEIEIFDLEEPSIIFKVEYLISQENVGNQLLVERFSLTDEAYRRHNPGLSPNYNENGLNRGLVLSISEAAFPHEITLMLLEPCSHIFWHYVVKDDKINRIERRADKQAFAVQLEQTLAGEITRNMNKEVCRMVQSGYQKKLGLPEITNTEVVESDFATLAAKKEGDIDLVYGRIFQFGSLFVETKLCFDYQANKLYFDWVEKLQDETVKATFKWQYTLLKEAESSRVYQASIRSSDGSQMICQIEQAISGSVSNKALRITISKIESENCTRPIFSLVVVDPSLLKDDFGVREDLKFALGLGYKDSLATVLKMDDFARDISLSKIQLPAPPQEPVKKPVSWSQVYRKILNQDDSQFIVSALSRTDPSMFKLNVFESNTNLQHNFLFNSGDVFSKEEISSFDAKPENLRQCIIEAVNLRLVIRQFISERTDDADLSRMVIPESNSPRLVFSASFLNQAAVQNKQQNKVATNQIFPDIEEFDIRRNCSHNFFQPTDLFAPAAPKPKQTLLTQYVRNEKIYDVFEVMDPFKLVLKVLLYDQMTFELIASAQCEEEEIRRELERDHKTHLLEGHLKEELARYLVSNTHIDAQRQMLFFQKSEIGKVKLKQPA